MRLVVLGVVGCAAVSLDASSAYGQAYGGPRVATSGAREFLAVVKAISAIDLKPGAPPPSLLRLKAMQTGIRWAPKTVKNKGHDGELGDNTDVMVTGTEAISEISFDWNTETSGDRLTKDLKHVGYTVKLVGCSMNTEHFIISRSGQKPIPLTNYHFGSGGDGNAIVSVKLDGIAQEADSKPIDGRC